MTTCLHRLLDANLLLPPEYADGLTSHLPMALHALQRLGATDARLQQFFDGYAARFDGRPAPPPADAVDDWRALRGAAAAHPALLATFRRRLDAAGRDALLADVLRHLLPGVAAAAFHGAIRTAHAVEAGHDGELAAALAYWAWRWQALPLPQPQEPVPDVRAWFAALVAAAAADQPPHGRLISRRMQQAGASAAYRALAGALRPQPSVLPGLAMLAAERYAATRDFTLLHVVTGLNAVRVLLPWVAEPAAALPFVVHAVTAALLSAGVGAGTPQVGAAPAWPGIIDRALQSDDDHVIKLVQACRDLEAACGGDHWRSAAAAAAGR